MNNRFISYLVLTLFSSLSWLHSQSVKLDSFQDVQLLNVQNCSVVQVNASWNYGNRVKVEQLSNLCYVAEIDIEDKVIGATIVKEWDISIAVTIFIIVGLWFNLQAEIEEAKELPEPPVSRTEYDLKDQMIRNSIMNTEEKVEKLEEKVDDIKEDTRSINDTLLKMNNN